MEVLAILFGLFVMGWVVLAPLVTLVMAWTARADVRRLREELQELEARVLALDARPAQRTPPEARPVEARPVEARPVEARPVEARPVEAPPVEAPPVEARPVEPVLEAPPVEAPPEAAPAEAAPEAPAEAAPAEAPPAAAPPRPARVPLKEPRPGPSIEQLGTWLFAGVGGLFVLLAGLLFFNYALDQGWFGRLGPGMRFALGIAGGLGLLGLSTQLRRRGYLVPAGAFSGGGLGLLYGAIYAGRWLYELYPQPVAFASMVGVTLVAGLLAWRWGSQFTAVLGLLGGLLTPILLSTGENNAVGLFSYLAMLAAGAAAVSVARGWTLTLSASALGTLAIHLGWAAKYMDPGQALYGFTAAVVFAAIYGAAALKGRGTTGDVASLAVLAQGLGVLPALMPMEVVDWSSAPARFEDPGGLGWLPLAWVALFAAMSLGLARVRGLPWLAYAAALALGLDQLVVMLAWASELGRVDTVSEALWWMPVAVALAPTLAARALRLDAGPVVLLTMLAGLAGGFAASAADLPLAPLAGWLPLGLVLLALAHPDDAPWSAPPGLLAAAMPIYGGLGALQGAGALGEVALPLAAIVAASTASPLLRPALRHQAGPWLASAASGPLVYLPLHLAWEHGLGVGTIGLLPLILGAVALVSVAWLRRALEAETSDRTLGYFILVATGFACLAVPVQLSRHWLVLGWAAEAVVLAWLSLRVPQPSLRAFSLGLALLATARLLPDPFMVDFPAPDMHPLFNIVVLTWLGLGLATLATAEGLARGGPMLQGLPVPTGLRTLGTLLLFGLLNVVLALAYAEEGRPRFEGGTFTQEMLRSVSWAVFGGALLTLGVLRANRGTRLMAMGFLMLAAVKVFFVDLWDLSGMYRVGSVLGAALTLLAAAVLLQKVVLGQRQADDAASDEE